MLTELTPTVPALPNHVELTVDASSLEFKVQEEETKWLQTVKAKSREESTLKKGDYVSWAAFHASSAPETAYEPAIISLLPMFQDEAHSVSMLLHAMNMVKSAVNVVNEGQPPVVAFDQPLYAIAKQIQWNWPLTHGEDKFFIMLGGLHIEMACLKMLGDWLDGSGWTAALVAAEICTSGIADSHLKASHLTRTRRAHQVTAAALFILQHDAYTRYTTNITENENPLTLTDWVSSMSRLYPQFQYWNLVLSLELMVLKMVYSIRVGNFDLYKKSLISIIPWMFSLDHINYARWLSVHIRDLQALPTTIPKVEEQFQKGLFVVHKSKHPFSAISLDHAHEQQNAIVKGEGGAVGLTSNPAALRRWMIAGPEIARVVQEFEATAFGPSRESCNSHHEQNLSFQTSFLKDVDSLVSTLKDLGNPFEEETGELFSLDSKEIMNADVINTVRNALSIGQAQYKQFVNERFEKRKKPITEAITKNKLPLFKAQPQKKTSKDKQKLVELKSDCSLFSRLYIACQSRDGNLEDFFRHENQPFPPSLSQAGKLREGQKSDLVKCLEKLTVSSREAPQVEGTVVDGAVLVQMLKPGNAQTIQEYADRVFVPHVVRQSECVQRLDVIWDVYQENSLKFSTREKRGSGIRIKVDSSTKIPKNWQAFLRSNDNKTALFRFLSKQLEANAIAGKQILSTYDDQVLSSPPMDTSSLECTHEEADTRMILHLQHLSNCGFRKLLIRTVDTDVVVLAVSAIQSLDVEEVWIGFGTGKHFRYIPAHTIAVQLGPQQSKALPMFHSLTGCDTVSFLAGRGKVTAWEVWNVFPQITTTLASLAAGPAQISDEEFADIERFVVLLYSKTSAQRDVNKARQELFAKSSRTLENIPPSQAALLQHVKRAVLQGGHIWGNMLIAKPALPCPSEWGWEQDDNNNWRPLWTVLPQAQKTCYELIHCGCIKGCKGHCKCSRANLVCTALCRCGGDCLDNQ